MQWVRSCDMCRRVPRMYGEFLRRAAAERMCHDVFLKDTSDLFGNGEYLAVFLIANLLQGVCVRARPMIYSKHMYASRHACAL
jgi:hypothetical protein